MLGKFNAFAQKRRPPEVIPTDEFQCQYLAIILTVDGAWLTRAVPGPMPWAKPRKQPVRTWVLQAPEPKYRMVHDVESELTGQHHDPYEGRPQCSGY